MTIYPPYAVRTQRTFVKVRCHTVLCGLETEVDVKQDRNGKWWGPNPPVCPGCGAETQVVSREK